MITANVKDAGAAALVNLAPGSSGKVQASGGADSFQDILNKQTDPADPAKRPGRAENGKKPSAEKADDGRQRVLRRNRTGDVEPESGTADPAQEPEELSEETMDAVKEAAAQLLFRMADAFGISVEDLRGMMQEMGISDAELLLPQQLSNLILEAGGAEGSFELVTDGELYEKFRGLMETREQLVGEIASDAGRKPEELLRELQAGTAAIPLEAKMPEDAVETPETEPGAEEEAGEELQIPDISQDAERTEENGENAENRSRQETSGREQREPFRNFENNPLMSPADPDTTVYEMRTESASQTMDADTQNIMRQILDYMKVQIRPETTSLEMQLHPASLGTLQIQLASKGGAVTAQFIAENEAVKAALENQMIQLRENFEEQGIRVEAIEVSVQTGRFEQSYEEQERNGEERQTSRARTGRRLRLDARTALEQTADLTDDERLAADLMAANGGTVDYMA